MRVAVTGGTGFIGRAIAHRLYHEGHEPVVLDNGSRHGASTGHDVRTVKAEDFRACEAVVHAAWINGTKNFYERPWAVIETGIYGTFNTLIEASIAGVREFHFISSSEVHAGATEFPTDELIPVGIPDIRNPRFSYGGGKIAGELMTLNCPFFDRVTVTRPNNVYGPNMGQDHVVPQLINKVKAGGTVEVQGGEQTRTFCYISDFVDGFMKVFEKGQHREIYNIGGDEEVKIIDLVNMMAALLQKDIGIKSVPVPAGDTFRRYPSIAKVRALGYTPTVDLTSGLMACI